MMSKARLSRDVPVLETTELKKAFGPTQALTGASVSLRSGEVHILLGENGSGKSTLAKILAGVHEPDQGSIHVNGAEVSTANTRHSRELGIAIVFQELSLAPDLTVADNLFLGTDASLSQFAIIDRRRERQSSSRVTSRLGLEIDLDMRVRQLPMAQKQMVEITKALLQDPLILIFDEPSSALSEREKLHLFQVIRRLKDEGVAILYITHHLREVAEIGDRVSVMRDGRIVVTTAVSKELTEARLLELLTGRQFIMKQSSKMAVQAAPILVVEGLCSPAIEGVTFSLRPGEIVGLYGVVGCGREDVARVLVGIMQPRAGRIVWKGKPLLVTSPDAALRVGISYLPMDRTENGILAVRSIRENLNLSSLDSFVRFGIVRLHRERKMTVKRLAELGVRYRSTEAAISTLSGGINKKVMFGRAMGPQPDLVILEDPTAGIDMGVKLELYQQLRLWADRGTCFLWLSSDLVETLSLCDRVYAMYAGNIVNEFIGPTLADEEALLAAVLGRATSRAASAI